jgi:hypothetical protein
MRRTEGRRTREIRENGIYRTAAGSTTVEDRGICCTHCSRSSSLPLDFKTTITVGIRYVLPICRSTRVVLLSVPASCCSLMTVAAAAGGDPGTRALAFLAGLQSGPSLSAHRLRDIELYIEEREEVSGAVGSCPL